MDQTGIAWWGSECRSSTMSAGVVGEKTLNVQPVGQ